MVTTAIVVVSCLDAGVDGVAPTSTIAPETATTPTSTMGTAGTTRPQPGDDRNAPVISEPLPLPEPLIMVGEGMVLAGYQTIDGQESWGEQWVGTISGGVSSRVVADDCYWDGWYLSPPHPLGSGGVILENGKGIVLCAPGQDVRIVPGRAGILGTAVIAGEEQGLLATQNGLALLNLEDLAFEVLADLDIDRWWPTAASHGAGRILVVLESKDGPIQDRDRIVSLLDESGEEIDLEVPILTGDESPHLATAAIAADGTTLLLAEEFSNGSTDLVFWDVDLTEQVARIRIIDAFVPGDDPYGFGREYVAYIDTSGDRVLVGLATVEAENYLSGVLTIGPDRAVHELSEVEGYGVIAASFND